MRVGFVSTFARSPTIPTPASRFATSRPCSVTRPPSAVPSTTWAVAREEYELEYGTDKLEIHRDAIHPRERILVVDDVLATGGTASATGRLVETLGGVIVGFGFLIELSDLHGRSRLGEHRVESLVTF